MEKEAAKTTVNKKVILTIIIAAVVVIAVVIGAVVFVLNQNKPLDVAESSGSIMLLPDANAKEGGAGGKTLDEMIEEMQETTDRSAIVVDYNPNMDFPDGKSEGMVQIGNPTENIFPMQFVITLMDTGEKLFESGLVPIGSHIDKITLSKDLPKGTHSAVLTYNAYDETTKEIVSHVSIEVSLMIRA